MKKFIKSFKTFVNENISYSIINQINIDNILSYCDNMYPRYIEDDDYNEVFEPYTELEIKEIIDIFDSLENPIKVYRSIYVDNENNIKLNDEVGECWSFDLDSALQFGSNVGCNYLLHGTIEKKYVNWFETIVCYVQNSYNQSESEDEINIDDVSKIENIKYYKIRDIRKNKNLIKNEVFNPNEYYGNVDDDIIYQYDKQDLKNEDGVKEIKLVKGDYSVKMSISNKTMSFKFYHNGSLDMTNKYVQYYVFKLVIDCLNYTISREKITNISYSAEDIKRHNIYKNVLNKLGFNLIRKIDNNYFYNNGSDINEVLNPNINYGYTENDFAIEVHTDFGDINTKYSKDSYNIYFEYSKISKSLNVFFDYKDDSYLTYKNEHFKVFRYISDLLNIYINKNDVKIISFDTEIDGDGDKRFKVYNNVLNKLNYKLQQKIKKGDMRTYYYQKINV